MIHTQDADFTLICADVLDGLATLEDGSVHCVVTSPPYWGLRDYGTGLWAGGDSGCDHQKPKQPDRIFKSGSGVDGRNCQSWTERDGSTFLDVCGKCGATRQDQQLGLEATPDLYVARIVEVFREVRRVLRDDGTCWVNMGDGYNANQGAGFNGQKRQDHANRHTVMARPDWLKPKDLVGMPWRVAFALQADGWYLRSDIIWAKPNPMPESVTDRPTKAHEYVFLLSKQARYFFDQEAVREPNTERWADSHYKYMNGNVDNYSMDAAKRDSPGIHGAINPAGRNVRSVWDIATQPYPEAHFATYPEELVRRCVLAGTSERGCCPVCGTPWEREVERESVSRPDLPRDHPEWRPSRYDNGKAGDPQSPGPGQRFSQVQTLGWRPGCNCPCPDCGIPYVHDADMRELPTDVREEAQPPAVLLTDLRESGEREAAPWTFDHVEGVCVPVPASAPGGVEAGPRDGASSGDGNEDRAVPAFGRSGASPKRIEGRQSPGELGSAAEADTRPQAEEAAEGSRMPGVWSEDRAAGREVRGCRCERGFPVQPCVVLDPFLGSGTTAYVARKHGRRSIGIELSPEYCDLAARRMQQQSLLV